MGPFCLILFGPPGSGKGTQAKLLQESLQLAHISTGDMLRERSARGDALGRQLAALLSSGQLVPDELVNPVVDERTRQPDCAGGFILDGYPRTVPQAGLLAALLERRRIEPVVIHFTVDYNVIIARLADRQTCPACGSVYGSASLPRVPGVCDKDGAKLTVRDDDREQVVRERLKAYEKQTAPVLDFFAQAGYACYEVAADGAPRAIAKRIEGLIENSLFQRRRQPV